MIKIKLASFLIFGFLLVSCAEDCKFDSISTTTLPDGTVGTEYYNKLELATSCSVPYRNFELTDGKIPKGMTLETSGEIIGTPTETGTFNFKIKARVCFGSNGFDWVDCSDKTKDFTLVIN